ncbi:MAG: Rne/Rng family ribonuclease [SAR324 cluster bacterium]|nr:Rne/Rng family ribonuclease [SAR324 cluster bacterium]
MTKNIKKMLINVNDDETRIAQVTGNTLDNLHIEQTSQERTVGNIYYGKVVKIQTSFQAAFIDYGAERHGFLPFSDVNSQLFRAAKNTKGRPSIDKVLRHGQVLLVQVTRNEIGHKGASLTTNISLPGRFLVFMPDSDKGGVSKKIEDAETRSRLKHLLEGLCGEKDSAIIRTAGVHRSLSELKRDFMMLRRKWNQILEKFENTSSPQLIFEEEDVVVRILRDFFIDDIAEIWIDHAEAFQRAREFFKASIPNKQKRLQFYLGDRSLFSVHGVETQIEQLSSNQVPLPSGGSLVIDPTEALVAIDVNSGRYSQSNNIEETALLTNTEAAEEVARQLRLRNLGGLIVIDFIDMFSEKNRAAVVSTLESYMQDDKAKWTLGTISQFGLLEMSRQRIANALSQETKTICPTCGGMGEVLSVSSLANAVLRKIRELAATENISEIQSWIPIELSNFLFNKKRQQLEELELEFGIHIVLTGDASIKLGILPAFEVISKKGVKTRVEEDDYKYLDDLKGRPKKSRSPRRRGKSSVQQVESTEEEKRPDEESSEESSEENSINSAESREESESLEQSAETAGSDDGKTVEKNREETLEPEDMPKAEDKVLESSGPEEEAAPVEVQAEAKEEEKNSNTAENIETKSSSADSEKSKIKGSALIPLYSSVHKKLTPEQQILSVSKPVDEAREKLKEIPPGTVIYSSPHRGLENINRSFSQTEPAKEVPAAKEEINAPEAASEAIPELAPEAGPKAAPQKSAARKSNRRPSSRGSQNRKTAGAKETDPASTKEAKEPLTETKSKTAAKKTTAKKKTAPSSKAKTGKAADEVKTPKPAARKSPAKKTPPKKEESDAKSAAKDTVKSEKAEPAKKANAPRKTTAKAKTGRTAKTKTGSSPAKKAEATKTAPE